MEEIKKRLTEIGIEDDKALTLLPFAMTHGTSSEKPVCILITGESGTGKTRLVRSLSSVSGRKVFSFDAKTFSETGYAGLDINTIFENVFVQSNGDLHEANNALIHIDEFDKLSSDSRERMVNSIGVQESLLRPLDGAEIQMVIEQSSRVRPTIRASVDTSNMIFIFTGAFCGRQISSIDSLVHCGIIRELANRVDFTFHLNKPSFHSLKQQFSNESSVIKGVKDFAKKYNLEVRFSSCFAEKATEVIYNSDGNHRSVNHFVNNVIYYKVLQLLNNSIAFYEFKGRDLNDL